ncbi:MAG: hypothetical protein KF729_34450 [Sandaracinaceae bacterium]|nr:hypothetical protein [Sandaracinaceae bacterium]
MRGVFLLFFSSTAIALSGCEPMEVTLDGGAAGDASSGPSGRILVESNATLTLGYGEAAELAVRYFEEGAPRAGEPLRFALDGTAQDAALRALTVTTGEDGRARTRLTAGSVRSVFRVRVSAERAAPAWIDVSVSDAGFGGLAVDARYEGARTDEARRMVTVYAGVACDPAGSYPASAIARQAGIEPGAAPEVTFQTLPAGLAYTVVGEVLGATGTRLASACKDAIEVVANETTAVTLRWEDAALAPSGEYAVELALELDDLGAVTTRGLDAGLAVAPPTAPEMLGALVAELRARGFELEADALALEVATGTAAADLASALDAAGADPAEGLRAFFAALLPLLGTVRVEGPLRLTYEAARIGGAWDARALSVGGAHDPDSPPPLPVALGDARLDPSLRLGWQPDTDTLAVESLSLALPLSTLVGAAMEAALAERTSVPWLALREAAGCEVLARWVADDAALRPVCNAACAEAACLAALDGALEAAAAAVRGEPSGGSLTVRGTVAAQDDDGDLVVDRLEGDLRGQWGGGVASPVGVSATFDGMRAHP